MSGPERASISLERVVASSRSQVVASRVVELLELMASVASPWGEERELAESIVAWGRTRADGVTWTSDRFESRRANAIATAGEGRDELVIYSHLDTSLSGDPVGDESITGRRDRVEPLRFDGVTFVGPGLGVAKGPAAAATIGYLAAVAALDEHAVAHRTSLLLAAGGTHHVAHAFGDHQSGHFANGVRHALQHGLAPRAAVVAKAGPEDVLFEEPGSAYIDIELRGRWTPAFARSDDEPGLVTRVAGVLTAIEAWRHAYVRRSAPSVNDRIAREAAVGAISGGAPTKRDLMPAVVHIGVYVVLGHGDDASVVAHEIRGAAAAAVAPSAIEVTTTVVAWEPAGRTDPTSHVVMAAMAATGRTASIKGWRGSTDGTAFRAAGIDTVRWGPQIASDPADARCDRVDLDVLVHAARVYAELAIRFALPV